MDEITKEMHRRIAAILESWKDDGKDRLPQGWTHDATATSMAHVIASTEENKKLPRSRIPKITENPDDTAVWIVNAGPWSFRQFVGSWGGYTIPAFGVAKIPGFLYEPGYPGSQVQNPPHPHTSASPPTRVDGIQIAREVTDGLFQHGIFIAIHRGPECRFIVSDIEAARIRLWHHCLDLAIEAMNALKVSPLHSGQIALDYLVACKWSLKVSFNINPVKVG